MLPNPFDLAGPEFLLFYFLLGVITAMIVRVARRTFLESAGQVGALDLANRIGKDPYAVAYLRGGRDELIRAALISLIERGLLAAGASKLVLADRDAEAKIRRSLDKTLVMAVAAEVDVPGLFSDTLVKREADLYGPPLQKLGVLPDNACRRASVMLFVVSALFLLLVAGIKIAVALSRGHSNVLFLVLMAVGFAFVLDRAANPRITALGAEACRGLRELFAGLHGRRETFRLSKTTSELTFLAAVFGIAALPYEVSKAMSFLRPRPQASSGGCGGGGCGGGGCGGGGCGGGCGGCS